MGPPEGDLQAPEPGVEYRFRNTSRGKGSHLQTIAEAGKVDLMAKGRMLLNRISNSKKLANLKTDSARLLYTWLLSHLDANGCFFADPHIVNSLVFTRLGKTSSEIASFLDDLNRVNLIVFYEKNGEKYLQFPDFSDKQINLRPDREGKSIIPKPKKDEIIPYSGVTPELLPPNIIEEKLIEVKLREAKKDDEKDNGQDKKTPSLKPTTEQKKELQSLCIKVNQKYPNFNPFAWIQKHINCNPEAHIHALKSLIENKASSPWAYADQIILVENGNYNEAENIKKHNEIKKSTPTIGEALRNAVSREMRDLSQD